MPQDIIAFVLFAVAASATPGPNNTMVAAAAASHGMRATVPHMLGIGVGFGVMVSLVGLGLSGPLAANPAVHRALRWAGAAWMVWIAFGIARGAVLPDAPIRPPLSFLGAALFQWVNPKAWVLAVATTATYVTPGQALPPQVLVLAGVFVLVSFPSTLLWCGIGAGVARVLRTPGQVRAFNLVMAGLLGASVLPLLVG